MRLRFVVTTEGSGCRERCCFAAFTAESHTQNVGFRRILPSGAPKHAEAHAACRRNYNLGAPLVLALHSGCAALTGSARRGGGADVRVRRRARVGPGVVVGERGSEARGRGGTVHNNRALFEAKSACKVDTRANRTVGKNQRQATARNPSAIRHQMAPEFAGSCGALPYWTSCPNFGLRTWLKE